MFHKVRKIFKMTQNIDQEQLKYMNTENCILLNVKDEIIGNDTKKNCHLVVNTDKNLHRAFSVFLFNSKGDLLLQQRAGEKITYPLYWTNTCCSHPIANFEDELDGVNGVKIAAIRKLNHELGIPMDSYKPEDFQFVTRIIYKSIFDETWMEHEIDYILLLQSKKDVEYNLNLNEVKDAKFCSQKEIKDILENEKLVTPWFKLISQDLLFQWWDKLLKSEKIDSDDLIHNFYNKKI